MKKKLIILENEPSISDAPFSQWINNRASEEYEIVIKAGLMFYNKDKYNELMGEIAHADAIAFDTSFNDIDQFRNIMGYISDIQSPAKIFISYIHKNRLSQYLNFDLYSDFPELWNTFRDIIEAGNTEIYEIMYKAVDEKSGKDSLFKSETYRHDEYKLISPTEINYITHDIRIRKNQPKKKRKKSTLKSFKKKLKNHMADQMRIWGVSEMNIEDFTALVDQV